ncbi:hypothetical protein C8R43DRAFT_1005478 [Mycena crocata]|nr:hypothetical protein C8R43DRAFT_1005478 [Mycena crocata]
MEQRKLQSVHRDPAIMSLLRSGRLPSSQQSDTIQTLIEDVKTTISREQDLIWDLQGQISVLEDREYVLEENQRVLESLFSPIRKLPPEIVQLVLELSVDANHFKTSPETSILIAARLASVCVQWRTIALSSPRIWGKFIVDDVNNTKAVRSIEEHLRLAGDTELDIDLRASAVVSHEIIALFCSHASRWRRATFQLGFITVKARDILSSAFENLPVLRALHIRHPDLYSAIGIDLFKSCPALGKLSLIEYRPEAASKSNIPWVQLTSIHYTPSDTRDMLTILDLCPNLVSFSMRLPATSSMPAAPTADPRSFPVLRTLRVDTRTEPRYREQLSGVLMVCSALTLPALHSLTFVSNTRRRYRTRDEPRHEEGQWPHAAVTAFLARSAAPLESLYLEGVPLDAGEALELLRLVPHASQVSLRECRTIHPEAVSESRLWRAVDDFGANHFVTNALLDALTVAAPLAVPTQEPAVSPLLPHLRHLALEVGTQLDLQRYTAMVRSRWPGPDAPRVLDSGVDRLDGVALVGMIHEESYWHPAPVLELRKEGLAVRFEDGEEHNGTDDRDESESEDDSDDAGYNYLGY